MLIKRKFLGFSLVILFIICAHAKPLPSSRAQTNSPKNIKLKVFRSNAHLQNPSQNEPVLYTLPKPIKKVGSSSQAEDNLPKFYVNNVDYDLLLRQLMEELVVRSHFEDQPDITSQENLQTTHTVNNNQHSAISFFQNISTYESQHNSSHDYAPLQHMINQNLTLNSNGNSTASIDAQKIRQQLEFLQKNAEKIKTFQQVQERSKNSTSQLDDLDFQNLEKFLVTNLNDTHFNQSDIFGTKHQNLETNIPNITSQEKSHKDISSQKYSIQRTNNSIKNTMENITQPQQSMNFSGEYLMTKQNYADPISLTEFLKKLNLKENDTLKDASSTKHISAMDEKSVYMTENKTSYPINILHPGTSDENNIIKILSVNSSKYKINGDKSTMDSETSTFHTELSINETIPKIDTSNQTYLEESSDLNKMIVLTKLNIEPTINKDITTIKINLKSQSNTEGLYNNTSFKFENVPNEKIVLNSLEDSTSRNDISDMGVRMNSSEILETFDITLDNLKTNSTLSHHINKKEEFNLKSNYKPDNNMDKSLESDTKNSNDKYNSTQSTNINFPGKDEDEIELISNKTKIMEYTNNIPDTILAINNNESSKKLKPSKTLAELKQHIDNQAEIKCTIEGLTTEMPFNDIKSDLPGSDPYLTIVLPNFNATTPEDSTEYSENYFTTEYPGIDEISPTKLTAHDFMRQSILNISTTSNAAGNERENIENSNKFMNSLIAIKSEENRQNPLVTNKSYELSNVVSKKPPTTQQVFVVTITTNYTNENLTTEQSYKDSITDFLESEPQETTEPQNSKFTEHIELADSEKITDSFMNYNTTKSSQNYKEFFFNNNSTSSHLAESESEEVTTTYENLTIYTTLDILESENLVTTTVIPILGTTENFEPTAQEETSKNYENYIKTESHQNDEIHDFTENFIMQDTSTPSIYALGENKDNTKLTNPQNSKIYEKLYTAESSNLLDEVVTKNPTTEQPLGVLTTLNYANNDFTTEEPSRDNLLETAITVLKNSIVVDQIESTTPDLLTTESPKNSEKYSLNDISTTAQLTTGSFELLDIESVKNPITEPFVEVFTTNNREYQYNDINRTNFSYTNVISNVNETNVIEDNRNNDISELIKNTPFNDQITKLLTTTDLNKIDSNYSIDFPKLTDVLNKDESREIQNENSIEILTDETIDQSLSNDIEYIDNNAKKYLISTSTIFELATKEDGLFHKQNLDIKNMKSNITAGIFSATSGPDIPETTTIDYATEDQNDLSATTEIIYYDELDITTEVPEIKTSDGGTKTNQTTLSPKNNLAIIENVNISNKIYYYEQHNSGNELEFKPIDEFSATTESSSQSTELSPNNLLIAVKKQNIFIKNVNRSSTEIQAEYEVKNTKNDSVSGNEKKVNSFSEIPIVQVNLFSILPSMETKRFTEEQASVQSIQGQKDTNINTQDATNTLLKHLILSEYNNKTELLDDLNKPKEYNKKNSSMPSYLENKNSSDEPHVLSSKDPLYSELFQKNEEDDNLKYYDISEQNNEKDYENEDFKVMPSSLDFSSFAKHAQNNNSQTTYLESQVFLSNETQSIFLQKSNLSKITNNNEMQNSNLETPSLSNASLESQVYHDNETQSVVHFFQSKTDASGINSSLPFDVNNSSFSSLKNTSQIIFLNEKVAFSNDLDMNYNKILNLQNFNTTSTLENNCEDKTFEMKDKNISHSQNNEEKTTITSNESNVTVNEFKTQGKHVSTDSMEDDSNKKEIIEIPQIQNIINERQDYSNIENKQSLKDLILSINANKLNAAASIETHTITDKLNISTNSLLDGNESKVPLLLESNTSYGIKNKTDSSLEEFNDDKIFEIEYDELSTLSDIVAHPSKFADINNKVLHNSSSTEFVHSFLESNISTDDLTSSLFIKIPNSQSTDKRYLMATVTINPNNGNDKISFTSTVPNNSMLQNLNTELFKTSITTDTPSNGEVIVNGNNISKGDFQQVLFGNKENDFIKEHNKTYEENSSTEISISPLYTLNRDDIEISSVTASTMTETEKFITLNNEGHISAITEDSNILMGNKLKKDVNVPNQNENIRTVTEVVWLTQSSSYQKPSIIIENVPYESSIPGPLYPITNDLTNEEKVNPLKSEIKSDHLSELISIIGNSLQASIQTNEYLQQKEYEQKNLNDNNSTKVQSLQKVHEDVTSTVNCHTTTMLISIPSSALATTMAMTAEEKEEGNNKKIEKTIENDKQNIEKWSTFKNNQLNNDSLTKSGNFIMNENVNSDDVDAIADTYTDAAGVDIDAYVNATDDDDDDDSNEGTNTFSNEKNMRLEMKVENKDIVNEKIDKNSDNERDIDNRNSDTGSTIQQHKERRTSNEFKASQSNGGINEMSTIENKLHDISKYKSNVMTKEATISYDKHEMVSNKNSEKDYPNKGNEMINTNMSNSKINSNFMSFIKTASKKDIDDDVTALEKSENIEKPNGEIKNMFDNLLKTQSFPAIAPHHLNSNHTNSNKNILASVQNKEEITTTNWWHSLPYAEIRKFLNSIFDIVTSTDNLNESVESIKSPKPIAATVTSSDKKTKTLKRRKSKKEQWSTWILNNIWSSLV